MLRAQPDRRLVALAREGHDAAIEEIVRRYRPALLRYAASIVPPDRADDVVQDSLARALPAIRSGEDRLHLRPWLYTIVRNAAFNDLRDAGPAWEHLDESYDGVEQPPQALERQERVRSLIAGLNRLPEAQRQALVKREMEGLSHADIGAGLGISGGAARQLIYRARTALRAGIGSLVPLPLLRQLLGGNGASGGAGAAGGGAIAAKAAIAVLATGAAVTAGVAIKDAHPRRTLPAPGSTGRVERGAPNAVGSGLTAFVAGRHEPARDGRPLGEESSSHLMTGVAKPTRGDGGRRQSGAGGDGRGAAGENGARSGTGHQGGEGQGGSRSGESGSGDGSGGSSGADSGSPGDETTANDGQAGQSGTSGDSGDAVTSTGGDTGSDGGTETDGSRDGSEGGASTLSSGQG